MRVISGTARGRKLLSLEGLDTRPTADRVKESMFNIIMPIVREAKVLDLFAGSGALGIEALSRGANSCIFVENSRAAADVIRKNLDGTKLSSNGRIMETDAVAFLKRCGEAFTLIFLDPPYNGGFYEDVLSLIASGNLLADGGILVLEKRADIKLSVPEGFSIEKERKYGKTAICIIQKGSVEND